MGVAVLVLESWTCGVCTHLLRVCAREGRATAPNDPPRCIVFPQGTRDLATPVSHACIFSAIFVPGYA